MEKIKIAYVGNNDGDTEFEIHKAGCQHLSPRRINPLASVDIIEVTDVEAFVDSEVQTYQDQQQGWDRSDFRIFPCVKVKKIKKPEPVEDEMKPIPVDFKNPNIEQYEKMTNVELAIEYARLSKVSKRNAAYKVVQGQRLDILRVLEDRDS